MEGAAKAAMAAGCTEFKPVFTPANLALVEAFMLVTALVTMLLTTSSDTTDASTEAPVINLVAGAALIWLAKELPMRPLCALLFSRQLTFSSNAKSIVLLQRTLCRSKTLKRIEKIAANESEGLGYWTYA